MKSDFNPRSPHGERRHLLWQTVRFLPFQSTLPARGATRTGFYRPQCSTDFNPRSPHGERRLPSALLMALAQFQSTLPARGATWHGICRQRQHGISIHAPRTGSDEAEKSISETATISIHAPRTGSDWACDAGCNRGADFNPRSPHGERQIRY